MIDSFEIQKKLRTLVYHYLQIVKFFLFIRKIMSLINATISNQILWYKELEVLATMISVILQVEKIHVCMTIVTLLRVVIFALLNDINSAIKSD